MSRLIGVLGLIRQESVSAFAVVSVLVGFSFNLSCQEKHKLVDSSPG